MLFHAKPVSERGPALLTFIGKEFIVALIKYGGGVVGMSGSIAGNTFARNRYGNYVRSRTKPINPNSAGQQVVRASLAFLTDRWSQELSADQRTQWNDYAAGVAMKNKLGESVFLSGFNHFLRSNIERKRTGMTLINNGPVINEIPAADPNFVITATTAPNEISIAFDNTMDWSVETNGVMFVYQGRPQNAQRNFFAGPWRLLTRIQGVDPAGADTPNVRATVFTIAEGQHLWVYARISRADGRISAPFRDDTFVAA